MLYPKYWSYGILTDYDKPKYSNLIKYIQNNIPYYKSKKDIPIVDKSLYNKFPDLFYNHQYIKLTNTESTASNDWGTSRHITRRMNKLEAIIICLKMLIPRYSIAMATGGTSGKAYHQYYNLYDSFDGARSHYQCLTNMGFDIRKHNLLIFYKHGCNFIQMLMGIGPIFNVHVLLPDIDNNDVTLKTVYELERYIYNYNIHTVITFPNLLFRVAQLMYMYNIKFRSYPKAIDISADMLFSFQYNFIKMLFKDTDIRMSYGTVEFGQIAQQLKLKGNTMTTDNMFTYKVLSDFAKVENTKDNKLVVTRYNYKVHPIVRYNVGDYGTVSSDGNTIYNLIGKKGSNVNYLQLDKYISTLNKNHKCQIINISFNKSLPIVTTISNDKYIIALLKRLFHKVIICKKGYCPSTDNYNTKIVK
jgi:hypothetical protein